MAAELLQLLLAYISEHKSELNNYSEMLTDGEATYITADNYAVALGEITKRAFDKHVSGDILPDGKMNDEIASIIIPNVLKNNYIDVNDYCKNTQKIFNEKKGLTFNPVNVEINQDRINGLVKFVSNSDEYDKIKDKFTESLINFNQSIVTDNIKANADFHYRSGKVQPLIRRMSTGKCCKWCSSKVGTYPYSSNMDTDVFRRHANCRCLVEYDNGSGIYQNVHTKKKYNVSKIDVRNRAESTLESENEKITKEDLQWIKKYTGFDSYMLNYKLRNNIVLNDNEIKFAEGLDMALLKMNKYKGDVIRVIDIDDLEDYNKFISMFEKKRTIKNISYWSSSKKTGYNDEANIKIYIKSKNGRDISRVNYEEQEILFMRNSKFRCEDKSVINGICRIFLTEI